MKDLKTRTSASIPSSLHVLLNTTHHQISNTPPVTLALPYRGGLDTGVVGPHSSAIPSTPTSPSLNSWPNCPDTRWELNNNR